MRKRILEMIAGILDELTVAKKVWRLERITTQVCKHFEKVLGEWEIGDNEGPSFYRYCADQFVRHLVSQAIRQRTKPRKGGDNEQLAFEGFPLIQAYYTIMRHRESIGVPVLQMTTPERDAKITELRLDGGTRLAHADQLERFFQANPDVAAEA